MPKPKPIMTEKNENLTGFLFVGPCLIGFAFFSIFPLIISLFFSFTNWNLIGGLSRIKFIGLANYKDLLTDINFLAALKNNALFGLYTIPVQLIGGFLIAVLINKHCYGKNIFRGIYFLPYISSTVAVATVFSFLFHPSFGPVNEFLQSIGISSPPKWIVDSNWALFSIAIMYSWQNIGYDIILFIAGLQSISKELYEAAKIDGANWFDQLKRITIPLVSPTTFFLLITEVMSTFRIFDQIQVLTEGGPGNSTTVLVYLLYQDAFKFHKVGYASAIAVILFGIVFVITYFQWIGRKKWVIYS